MLYACAILVQTIHLINLSIINTDRAGTILYHTIPYHAVPYRITLHHHLICSPPSSSSPGLIADFRFFPHTSDVLLGFTFFALLLFYISISPPLLFSFSLFSFFSFFSFRSFPFFSSYLLLDILYFRLRLLLLIPPHIFRFFSFNFPFFFLLLVWSGHPYLSVLEVSVLFSRRFSSA